MRKKFNKIAGFLTACTMALASVPFNVYAEDIQGLLVLKAEQAAEPDIVQLRDKLISLINSERKEADMKPLEANSYLNECAAIRAEELKKDFSHNRPDGTNFMTVIDEEILSFKTTPKLSAEDRKRPKK